jgi:antirestriction protein
MSEPRIYVACLASYNAGRLHGEWIDLEPGIEATDIHDRIQDMLQSSPEPRAEEWAIHDFEGFNAPNGQIQIGEWADLDDLSNLAYLISEYGEAFGACLDVFGESYVMGAEEGPEVFFQDRYQGSFRDIGEWAEEYLDGTGMVPEGIAAQYFDYERFGRDCVLGGDISTTSGGEGIHVFSNH